MFIETVKQHIPVVVLEPQVEAVRQDLLRKVGDDPKDQIETLIYNAAWQNLQLSHERNYSLIFGSQLRLLEQMRVEGPVAQTVARQVYEAAKAQDPGLYATYSFEHWIGYLIDSGLIAADQTTYQLTPFGFGFLRYIFDRHLTI